MLDVVGHDQRIGLHFLLESVEGGGVACRLDHLYMRSLCSAQQVATGSNSSSSEQQNCCVKGIAYG